MKSKFMAAVPLVIAALTSCAQPQGDDRLKDKANIEADADQARTDAKAMEMEARLRRQQRFYQAVRGTFTGEIKIEDRVFNATVTLTPTIQAYDGAHTRTIEEITYDLTNLSLNIQATASKKLPNGSDLTVGCIYPDIKPKVDSGSILATANGCALSWTMNLGDPNPSKGQVRESKESITRKVLDGSLDEIDQLTVELRSVNKATVTVFPVFRQN